MILALEMRSGGTARSLPDRYAAQQALFRPEDHDEEQVTLVRWPAGHEEPRHDHPHGEEILVLEGDFADEHGSYGTRAWVRQPAGSAHAPHTRAGCLMWVKRGLL